MDLILRGKRPPATGVKIFGNPGISANPRFFGRTDLWINLSTTSRPKFDEESDFEVRLAVAPQKQRQISEKQNYRSEIFAEQFFLSSKNETLESSETRFGKVSYRSEPCWRSYEKLSPDDRSKISN